MFWSKSKINTPEDLSQAWILDGFKKSIDGFFVLQGDTFGSAQENSSLKDRLYISPNFLQMIGYTNPENYMNDVTWWHDNIHPEDKNRLLSYIQARRFGTTSQKQIEYRFRHRAGHWIWLLLQTHVYHAQITPDGQDIGWIMGVITNISSFRVLQDQLERTIEEAEKSSLAKSKFIASLNHELRTPLNGILGMTNFLKESSLSPEQTGYIENIAASAQLLLTLVNDILDVSKITAGKLELEEHPFNLQKQLENTVTLLKPLAQSKNLELALIIDSAIPHWVLGDQVRLQQIITNLLNNAIKFSETGKITISAQLRGAPASDPKKTLVLFKIIDPGVGIPADILPKLFQDFTQADSSVTRTHGGTGLGLSICKKLINLMRGEIGVQSTLNKGSTFWFSIPYEPTDPVEAEESETQKPQKDLSKLKILIAEDNSINQQVIQGLIQNLGGKVELANNGQIALDLFKKSKKEGAPFDVIFMDINMPLLNGYDATKAIRELEPENTTIIIACTADTITHNRNEFIQKGFTDIISKPINKQDLFTILQKYGPENQLNEPTSATNESSQNSQSDETPLINMTVIETLKEDIGSDVLENLLITYKSDAKEIVDQLLQDKPIQETHDLAHALAGISENLGIQAVGKLSRSLMVITHELSKEQIPLSSKEEEKISGIISQLHSQFQDSIKAIEKL